MKLMQKEKSKVVFGVLTASLSACLVLCMILGSITSSYTDDIHYRETQIILKLMSQTADLDLIHFIDIKNELGILTQDKSFLSALVTSGDAGARFRESAQKRADSFSEGIRKYSCDLLALYRKRRIFSVLTNGSLFLALVLNIFCIEYGLRIHGLYKTRRDILHNRPASTGYVKERAEPPVSADAPTARG